MGQGGWTYSFLSCAGLSYPERMPSKYLKKIRIVPFILFLLFAPGVYTDKGLTQFNTDCKLLLRETLGRK